MKHPLPPEPTICLVSNQLQPLAVSKTAEEGSVGLVIVVLIPGKDLKNSGASGSHPLPPLPNVTDCTAAESVTFVHLALYNVPCIVPPPDPNDLFDVNAETTAVTVAPDPFPPHILNVGAVVYPVPPHTTSTPDTDPPVTSSLT